MFRPFTNVDLFVITLAFAVVTDNGKEILLTDYLDSPSLMDVMIPIAGSPATNYSVVMRAHITDEWGAVTTVETTIQVTPNPALDNLSPTVRH